LQCSLPQKCFLEIDPTVVERPTDDDCTGTGIGHIGDVVNGTDTSAGNDAQARDRNHTFKRFDVGAFQRTVTGDIGEDDGADAVRTEALGGLECVKVRLLGPAANSQFAVSRIQSGRHLIGPRFRDKLGLLRAADDDRAKHNPVHP